MSGRTPSVVHSSSVQEDRWVEFLSCNSRQLNPEIALKLPVCGSDLGCVPIAAAAGIATIAAIAPIAGNFVYVLRPSYKVRTFLWILSIFRQEARS